MGRATRRTAPRAGRPRRAWLPLLVGLTLGAGLTLGIQYYISRSAYPGSGLKELFAAKSEAPPARKPDKPAAAPAAKPKLDFYTVLPEVETVLPERAAKTAAAKPGRPEADSGASYMLQAASFSNAEDADRLRARLALAGLEAHIERVTIEGKGEYHRVRLGPYTNLQELDAADQKLAQLGVKAIRLKVRKAAGA
jgi:cell division protein FtsN